MIRKRSKRIIKFKTIQNSNPTTDGIIQMLLELHQLGAVTAALQSLFHASCLTVNNFFLTLNPNLPLMQFHAIPLGPCHCHQGDFIQQ